MVTQKLPAPAPTFSKGAAHCPMCTHTVDAEIVHLGRRVFVKPGQKCPRCSGTLDAAMIVRYDKAA